MSTLTATVRPLSGQQKRSKSTGSSAIEVHAHEDEGSWWAETPDFPGLSVAAPSREELVRRIKPAVQFHLQDCGVEFDPEGLSILIMFQVAGNSW